MHYDNAIKKHHRGISICTAEGGPDCSSEYCEPGVDAKCLEFNNICRFGTGICSRVDWPTFGGDTPVPPPPDYPDTPCYDDPDITVGEEVWCPYLGCCDGVSTCMPDGLWSACILDPTSPDAAHFGPEICDGYDNDCNCAVDDSGLSGRHICNDFNACTIDDCRPDEGGCINTDAGPSLCFDGIDCTVDICTSIPFATTDVRSCSHYPDPLMVSFYEPISLARTYCEEHFDQDNIHGCFCKQGFVYCNPSARPGSVGCEKEYPCDSANCMWQGCCDANPDCYESPHNYSLCKDTINQCRLRREYFGGLIEVNIASTDYCDEIHRIDTDTCCNGSCGGVGYDPEGDRCGGSERSYSHPTLGYSLGTVYCTRDFHWIDNCASADNCCNNLICQPTLPPHHRCIHDGAVTDGDSCDDGLDCTGDTEVCKQGPMYQWTKIIDGVTYLYNAACLGDNVGCPPVSFCYIHPDRSFPGNLGVDCRPECGDEGGCGGHWMASANPSYPQCFDNFFDPGAHRVPPPPPNTDGCYWNDLPTLDPSTRPPPDTLDEALWECWYYYPDLVSSDACFDRVSCVDAWTQCVAVPTDCDDAIDCTVDDCDYVLGCINIPDDDLCVEDGYICTDNHRCDVSAGGCTADYDHGWCYFHFGSCARCDPAAADPDGDGLPSHGCDIFC